MPDGEMKRKVENDFMAGCVRFWVWFPAAASCTHKKDSMYGVSQTCLDHPLQLAELDPDGENRSLPGMPIISSVLGGPRN